LTGNTEVFGEAVLITEKIMELDGDPLSSAAADDLY